MHTKSSDDELMEVMEVIEQDGENCLQAAQRPIPKPGNGEVLIKVAAAGVNRPDLLQVKGHYPPPPGASDLPGLEVAGTICALGEGVDTTLMHADVCALLPGGGYAAYATAPIETIMSIPRGLTMVEAASLPEVCMTVWHNVFERGHLKNGEIFLVHGGSSGIGLAAIQLAHLNGARVLTTVGNVEKAETVRKLGAERAIIYGEEDFVEVVKAATDGHGADLILDMVGGDYIERNYRAAAIEGRIVQIAFMGGMSSKINMRDLMMKRLVHTGSTLRARALPFKGALARAVERHVWPLLESKDMTTVIHETFPLKEASKAHALMQSSQHIGKIVLVI